jgi:hypothetical protein
MTDIDRTADIDISRGFAQMTVRIPLTGHVSQEWVKPAADAGPTAPGGAGSVPQLAGRPAAEAKARSSRRMSGPAGW